jgi:hypothetical protein
MAFRMAARSLLAHQLAPTNTAFDSYASCRRALAAYAKLRRFDFERPDTYVSALEGIDRLFLLTRYTVTMLEHSKNLIDVARAAGVSHVVHLGLSFTHLHPNTFMQNFIGAVSENSLRMFLAAQRVGLIDCKDAAEIQRLRNSHRPCGNILSGVHQA